MKRLTAAAVPLVLIGFNFVGCADAKRSANRPAKPAESAVVAVPAVTVLDPVAEPEPEAPASRLLLSDQTQWITRADLFEVGRLPVRSIRVEGAMFAASTRAAISSQRPTATLRVVRMRYTPRFKSSDAEASEGYSLEIEQRPGGRVTIGEPESRGLLDAILNGTAATHQPQPIVSEIAFGKVRIVIDRDRGDEARIETEKATATYDRAGLAEKLTRAIAMIDGLRAAAPKSE